MRNLTLNFFISRAFLFIVMNSLFCILRLENSYGFVLLSGPEEAKLNANPENPTVFMQWDGRKPTITHVEEFLGAEWINESSDLIVEEIIRRSLDLWNQVPGSFIELDLEVVANTQADAMDHKHSIVVDKMKSKTAAAFARPTIEDGIIVDCDVTLSDRKVSAKSLAYTLVHELGHCLGLGHPHTHYGAIMGYSRNPESVSLGADDMAGIIYLYMDPQYTNTAGSYNYNACGSVNISSLSNQQKYLSNNGNEGKKIYTWLVGILCFFPLVASLGIYVSTQIFNFRP